MKKGKKFVALREGLLYRPLPHREEVSAEPEPPAKEDEQECPVGVERYNVEKAMEDVKAQQDDGLGWFRT